MFEPGIDRAFDMKRILGSHFGSHRDLTASEGFSEAKREDSSSSLISKNRKKSLKDFYQNDEASDDLSSSSLEEHAPSGAPTLLSLCVFTCYWGVDDTPVVVGLRSAGPEDLEGQYASREMEEDDEELRNEVRRLKVGVQ